MSQKRIVKTEPDCVCKAPFVVNRRCTACGRLAAPEPFVRSVMPFDVSGIDHIVLAAARGESCDRCREGAALFVRCGTCRKIHRRCGQHAEHIIQNRDDCCRATVPE